MPDLETSNLYYLPLTPRNDGILSPPEGAGLHGSDLPLIHDLNDFIAANYVETEGVVDTSGRLYEAQVFRPKTTGDHWYTIVSESGTPVFRKTEQNELPSTELAIFEPATRVIEQSEALSPQESVFISDSFIEPEFEEIDKDGSARRHVTWSALTEMPKVMIIGPPGAGKTTTLRRLALQYLDAWRSDGEGAFPVYVQMRHLHEGGGVEQVVRRNLLEYEQEFGDNESKLDLLNVRMVLILDGLDEMPELIRENTIDAISAVAQKHQVLSIIASTREAGYRWQIPSFRYLRILPFTTAKIREWSFYRLKEGAAEWQNFMTSLEERRELVELSGNPLLLSLAVSLYRRSSTLPQNRSTLLKSYFDAVTEQWDSVRGVVRQRDLWAAPTRKIAALCRVAYYVRSSGREFFTDAEFRELNTEFSVDDSLLRVCERDTGVVTEATQGRWCFTHRTFSDYLAARYVVDHTSDVSQSLEPFFKSGDWLDVWAYSCGIAQNATNLVYIILHNRRIPRTQKLEALAAAFEQDIIVSSNATRDSVSLFREEINRLFLKTPTISRKSRSQLGRNWSVRFDGRNTLHTEALTLLRSLQRLRKSRMGEQVLIWLSESDSKISEELAGILSTTGIVWIAAKPSSQGQTVTVGRSDELATIGKRVS